jgi:hypothetical protein
LFVIVVLAFLGYEFVLPLLFSALNTTERDAEALFFSIVVDLEYIGVILLLIGIVYAFIWNSSRNKS